MLIRLDGDCSEIDDLGGGVDGSRRITLNHSQHTAPDAPVIHNTCEQVHTIHRRSLVVMVSPKRAKVGRLTRDTSPFAAPRLRGLVAAT